ncbi:aldose epimerase family protein [Herbivorax sp. ANBcel31]|uniref:aldose epimerase family protein n=1 Tax=Herbivorax sp. ANBcel31 TaxID=3069754 RepID=UPI0027B82BFE|nr:aldose epimerase family protein [Herbivorax sp. ANBcel31]MDQ2084862.1 aldose epimerase family protein [Herbivorax sp. ANBcel31]
MGIIKEKFSEGKDLDNIYIYTLSNDSGMKAKITNYGGIVVSLFVPDNSGKVDDVVLGYDNIRSYFKNSCYYGGIVGRHANRIEGASFELNGKVYNLAKNDGENHIHGGNIGFHSVIWNAEIMKKDDVECLKLSYRSKDGEENYPGNLDVTVIYKVTKDNALSIEYYAVSDKDTVVNLTNHSYFNLSGHGFGDVLNHEVMINAEKFTPIDEYSIPTGEIREVSGTPMDFRQMKPIKKAIEEKDNQILYGKGFDHNWVLDTKDIMQKAAEVFDPISKRRMEVYTTKLGVQFYTGNNIADSQVGKDGVKYKKRSGICLETQYFPNALKHKHFPSPILKAGDEYKHKTIYKFV